MVTVRWYLCCPQDGTVYCGVHDECVEWALDRHRAKFFPSYHQALIENVLILEPIYESVGYYTTDIQVALFVGNSDDEWLIVDSVQYFNKGILTNG